MKYPGLLSSVSCLLLLACSSSPQLIKWEFTGGPYAQNISAVFVDEHDTSHLMAALATGDVYSSKNGGISWARLSTLPANTAIRRFIQHPDEPKRFFVATTTGVFLSTNAGENWNPVTIDLASSNPQSYILAVEPYNTQVMYTGLTGRGIYKSTDGGISWKAINGGLDSLSLLKSDVYDIVIDPSKPDNVYAAVGGIGVVKSTNGGGSWTTLTSIIGSGGVAPTSIVQSRKSPAVLCFGMEAGSIYKSVDGGQTWSPTRFGSGNNSPVCLLVDPVHSEVLYAGTENDVSMSTDFGTTWKSVANELPHVATAIAIASGEPNPTLYAYGEGIGLSKSTDAGSSWSTMQVHLGGSTVSAMAGNKRRDVLYAAVGASVHQWNPQSRSWSSASNNLTGGAIASIAVATDSSSNVYAATANGIFSTSDGGNSWRAGSPQMRGKSVSLIATHPIFTTRILAETQSELFASTNKGVTWTPTRPLDDRYRVRSFTFSNTNAGVVLGATERSGVILSTNGGLSWERNQYGLESNDLTTVTFDEEDKQTFYAWTVRGTGFRSTNKGLVWDRYATPWQPGDQVSIAVDRYKPSDVVAFIRPDRFYYSVSGGARWFSLPVDSLLGDVAATYWDSERGWFYVSVKNLGVYRIVLREYLKEVFEE